MVLTFKNRDFRTFAFYVPVNIIAKKVGIFSDARTFMIKMGIALANFLLPSLLLLGKSAARYDERRVLGVLARKEGH